MATLLQSMLAWARLHGQWLMAIFVRFGPSCVWVSSHTLCTVSPSHLSHAVTRLCRHISLAGPPNLPYTSTFSLGSGGHSTSCCPVSSSYWGCCCSLTFTNLLVSCRHSLPWVVSCGPWVVTVCRTIAAGRTPPCLDPSCQEWCILESATSWLFYLISFCALSCV